MSKNEITGNSMITKPSLTYSDRFDNIFRKSKKAYYAIEYVDGIQDYISFDTDYEANEYYTKHKTEIAIFEKRQLLQE